MAWLTDWERIEIPGHGGGDFTGDEPWRCVLHSTEGLSIESAVGAYSTGGVPPQCTIDPAQRRKAQHIDTDRSAYAVINQPGGVETNRWRAIQVEIVMFADEAKAQQYGGLYVGDLTDEHYAFIRSCLFELQADKPFTFDGPDFVAYPASYGFHAAQRMTAEEWRVFNGTCGHEHVLENDHGDPGALDRARLFPKTSTPIALKETDMPASFIYNLDLDDFSVNDKGELVTRFFQHPGGWSKLTLGAGCVPHAVPEIVRGFPVYGDDPAATPNRLDVFVDAVGGGRAHAWYLPGAKWAFETLA